MKSTLLRIQNALVESTKPTRESIEAGGFVVMLTLNDPLVWINYAIPLSDPTTEGVDEMITAFRSSNRTPRLEFFADLWPGAVSTLEEKGFVCEKRMPIMVIKRDDWRGLSHEHKIQSVSSQTFHELNQVLAEAFGVAPAKPSAEQIDATDDPIYQRIASGETLASVASVDDKIVGGGLAIGTSLIREIAGIGTSSKYRKQGIASAVIAHLLDQFFLADGEIAWLTPGDNTAQSVYSNLGFRTVAEQVVYVLPDLENASEA